MNRIILSLLAIAASLAAQTQPDRIPEVPEPTTYLLMAAGLGAIAYSRHRLTRKK